MLLDIFPNFSSYLSTLLLTIIIFIDSNKTFTQCLFPIYGGISTFYQFLVNYFPHPPAYSINHQKFLNRKYYRKGFRKSPYFYCYNPLVFAPYFTLKILYFYCSHYFIIINIMKFSTTLYIYTFDSSPNRLSETI